MSVYNYLLLLVPVVGVAMILAAFYWTDRAGRNERLHPGE